MRHRNNDLPPPGTSFIIRRALRDARLSPERLLYLGKWGRQTLYIVPAVEGEFTGYLEGTLKAINHALRRMKLPVRVIMAVRAEPLEAAAAEQLEHQDQ